MNVLIIGSKGFIGAHVVMHFKEKIGYTIFSCDVAVDYTTKNYFQLDAANSDYHELFEQIAFDICINCSGAASVPDSFNHPYRDYMLNTVNVYKILEAIRKYTPQCRFINLSSAAVYGNPVSLPVNEETTVSPVSPYGSHKQQAELICKEYFRFFGIRCCSLRIFSAYGAGLTKQLFWDLAQKARSGDKINLFGNGHESRDFIYVKDIVQVIELIIHKADFTAEFYNVANGVQLTIKEVAEKFLHLLEWNGSLAFQGAGRQGDPSNWQADISKIKALGYISSFPIEQGLKKYVEWLNEQKLG